MTAVFPEKVSDKRLRAKPVSRVKHKKMRQFRRKTSDIEKSVCGAHTFQIKGNHMQTIAEKKVFRRGISMHSYWTIRPHFGTVVPEMNKLMEPVRAMFTDPAKATEFIPKPKEFMDNVFLAGSISPNTLAHPDIFSHFTTDELIGLGISRNNKLYFSFGISAEEGEYVSSIAKPLIEDIVAKADEAVKPESGRAADLRFGHDVGLLPLIGTIGIAGMEERWKSLDVHRHWFDFEMMPMASNLQMIFFRNRKGDVLVKLVYNDKETYIPAVQTYNGVFHKWNDLREYLVKTAAAISDEHIVKDNDGKERTGVAGM